MSNSEFLKAGHSFPLLDKNGSCTVYGVRPIACRAWYSLSADACDDCYLADHICNKIPLDDHAYQIGQGVRSGLARSLNDQGLDGNVYQLNSALSTALDTPDAAERWARGEDVFANSHLA